MGIFDSQPLVRKDGVKVPSVFSRYRASLEFRGKVMGGIPGDPEAIEGWIRSKAKIDDTKEMQYMMLRTLQETNPDAFDPNMSVPEMFEVAKKLAGQQQTQVFKRDANGLYLESRQVKAMLREAVSILFGDWQGSSAKQREVWGVPKSAKAYTAERVFVNPDELYVGRDAADGVDLTVGHVQTQQGPRSTLTYHEFLVRPKVTFDVLVLNDRGGKDGKEVEDLIPDWWWPQIWQFAQENALGTLRSQGYGRFDIMQWDRVDALSSAPTIVQDGKLTLAR